jgi:hypothetical protein
MRRIKHVPHEAGNPYDYRHGGVFVAGDVVLYFDRDGMIGIDTSNGEYAPAYVPLGELEKALRGGLDEALNRYLSNPEGT